MKTRKKKFLMEGIDEILLVAKCKENQNGLASFCFHGMFCGHFVNKILISFFNAECCQEKIESDMCYLVRAKLISLKKNIIHAEAVNIRAVDL